MYDVLVVGGGPAGCATALAAARGGLSVGMLTGPARGRSWAGESLPPGAAAVIERALAPGVLAAAAPAYGVHSSWGSTDLAETDFLANPLGGGRHLDRAAFDEQARAEAADLGVTLTQGSLGSLSRAEGGWLVNDDIVARWVVDASGRAGAVMGRLGITRTRLDRQVAMIAVVPNADERAVTTVESAPDGWWYSTPLPHANRRVVAYLTDADLVPPPLQRAAWWREELNATRHIGRLTDECDAEPALYPADTSVRRELCGDGWVAVGDAAISWDPMSSQGLITGVLMGARAGEALAAGAGLKDWERDYRLLLDEHEDVRRILVVAEDRWPDRPFWQRRRGHEGGVR